jgi:hypothetical protein
MRAGEGAAMKSGYFLAEGKMEIGSKEQFFTMLDGDYLG